jgi:hypothetical protein
MCNAHNHPPGCTCGWGGDGHLGRGGGGRQSSYREFHSSEVKTWKMEKDRDFCSPTKCPKCGLPVFFVRHNGGSVWFDELGYPWTKHGCFDDEYPSVLSNHSYSKRDNVSLGVIIRTEAAVRSRSARIAVHCFDGTIIDEKFEVNSDLDFSTIIGSIVIVERSPNNITLYWN